MRAAVDEGESHLHHLLIRDAFEPCDLDRHSGDGEIAACQGTLLRMRSAAGALPTAQALLRIAPALLAAGLAIPAAQALPLYIRDKVAQTTQERAIIRAAAGKP